MFLPELAECTLHIGGTVQTVIHTLLYSVTAQLWSKLSYLHFLDEDSEDQRVTVCLWIHNW